MKYSEISEEADLRKKLLYIDENWSSGENWRQGSLKRITNYLFTLNSGGLLASLVYLASKEAPADVKVLIWCFLVGTVSITLHAVIDYYQSESELKKFNSDLDKFYSNSLAWEDLVKNKTANRSSDIPMHILGWIAGLSFFVGLFLTAGKIQTKAEQDGTDQPATALESNSKDNQKPKSVSEGRSQ